MQGRYEQPIRCECSIALSEYRGAYGSDHGAVSYTHLRAHETVLDLVCRLLLEKKNNERQRATQSSERR